MDNTIRTYTALRAEQYASHDHPADETSLPQATDKRQKGGQAYRKQQQHSSSGHAPKSLFEDDTISVSIEALMTYLENLSETDTPSIDRLKIENLILDLQNLQEQGFRQINILSGKTFIETIENAVADLNASASIPSNL